jgi:hypothetical protein
MTGKVDLLEHGHMAPGLHGACFSKMGHNFFKKIKTKMLYIDNNEIYQYAKIQVKIHCI